MSCYEDGEDKAAGRLCASPSRNAVPLLPEHEAAHVLGLSVATLRKWRWAGRGPAFRKIGACVRYHLDDLTAFIEAARRSSTSDPGPSA